MERPRCLHCRNPIKEHQAAVGPMEGDRTFHEDCWKATHPDAVADEAAVPVVDEVADEVAEPVVEQRRRQPSSEQHDYEQRIASGGLAALLSPYVSRLPAQRTGAESIPA